MNFRSQLHSTFASFFISKSTIPHYSFPTIFHSFHSFFPHHVSLLSLLSLLVLPDAGERDLTTAVLLRQQQALSGTGTAQGARYVRSPTIDMIIIVYYLSCRQNKTPKSLFLSKEILKTATQNYEY